ncbi:MAG: energy-coupling factor ABC transporter ATP-binding protein [Halobacteriales archaeon]
MTAVATTELSVRTTGGQAILSDVSIEIEHGETVLLCGQPGSGKSMLLKAIKGLLADRDDLRVDGEISRTADIGIVFQNPAQQLVRSTVRRDIAFGLENRGIAVPEIESRIERYAELLEATHLLDRPTEALSHGEAATVALLGMLVVEPAIILLDEPLATLDYPNQQLVIDSIDRLIASDRTVVIAEHDTRELLDRVDRVLLLEDGTIERTGQPSALGPALYAAGMAVPFELELQLAAEQTPPERSDQSTQAGIERRE